MTDAAGRTTEGNEGNQEDLKRPKDFSFCGRFRFLLVPLRCLRCLL